MPSSFMTADLICPELIYTHESDLDGLLSGLLLKRLAAKLFGREVRIEALHNHQWKLRTFNEKSAWVSDFAFEKRLDRSGWLVVDHHQCEGTPAWCRLIHDPEKSSGLLAYELCQKEGLGSAALDRLVHLNNVSDLFHDTDPDFALACDYANLVKTYGFWNLYQLIEGNIERLVDHPLLEVMKVKRVVEDPIGFEWSRVRTEEIVPGVGFVQTVIGNSNLIIHRMLEEKVTPFPVLITLFRRGNGTILVSLRSNGGEALPVAVKLHGGGHPNAAGASLPRSVSSIPEAVRWLRQALSSSSANLSAGLNAGALDLEQAFNRNRGR